MIRYLTSGESHGPQLDIIIDGFPSNFKLDLDRINNDLAKRQEKIGSGNRQNIEHDTVTVNSGLMNGMTTGSPLAFSIANKNHRDWKDKSIKAFTKPRPGHADKAGAFKYQLDDIRKVLERASARETASRVVLGSCCMQLLEQLDIHVKTTIKTYGTSRKSASFLIPKDEVKDAKDKGETIGGILTSIVTNMIPGIGSFTQPDRRLDSKLAAALISIPAIKGIEFGKGFELASMYGTEAQQYLGGISGGMSDGNDIEINLVMKPIPTTIKKQDTIDLVSMEKCQTEYERSDIAPIFRTPIIVDSMIAYIILNELIDIFGGDTFEELRSRYQTKKNSRYYIKDNNKVFWK